MNVSQFYLSIAVGLVISLITEETIGIICGGAIVSGYMAMVCDEPKTMLLILLIAALDYLIVEYILPHFVIIYGKRRFVACLMVGLVLKLSADFFVPILPLSTLTLRGTGVMVPGLLASTSAKQGFHITIPAALVATYLTFGIVQLLLLVI